jgi:hypothetical protein
MKFHSLLVVVFGIFSPGVLTAAEPNLLTNPFYVSLGTYIVNSDTKLELDGEAGTGDRVDLERTFGDDTANRFRIDAYWRFAGKHKLRALWFDSSRSASRVLEEEINWGDETFPVGAEVDFDFDFSIYELAYEYAFLRRQNFEIAGSAGLHYTKFAARLSAELGQPGATTEESDSARVDAPLPVFGLRGIWNPGGNFWIDGSAQIFSLSIDEYDGRLTDYRLAALWQPKKWLGLGVGYNAFTVDVDVDKDSFRGSMKWTYKGPQVFLSASF